MPVPLFPRGERSPGKRRPSSSSENPSAKRKKQRRSEDDSPLKRDNNDSSRPPSAHSTFRYPPHTKLLGVVALVCSDRLLVDLPCGQKGFVLLAEAIGAEDSTNNILSQVYKKGQYILCQVLGANEHQNGPKGHLPLTMRPAILNQGVEWPPVKNQLLLIRVTSVEEHGFHGSLDIKDKQASSQVFAKVTAHEQMEHVRVGSFQFVTVEAVKKESKLVVARFGDDASLRYISVNTEMDKGSLLAGQLCECAVTAVSAPPSSSNTTNTVLPAKKKHAITKCFPQGVASIDVRLGNTMTAMIPRLHVHHPFSRLKTDMGGEQSTNNEDTALVWPYKAKTEGVSAKNVQKRLHTWPILCPRFGTNDRFLGRVIAVIPGNTGTAASATLIVSALAHVVHLRNELVTSPLSSVQSGCKIAAARIAEIETGIGIRAIAADGPNDVAETNATDPQLQEWKMPFDKAFLVHCAKDKVAEEGIEAKMMKMSLGQRQEFRVLSVNLFDAVVSAGMSQKLLDEQYVGLADIAVGNVVKGTVAKRTDSQLTVELSSHLRARVRKEHLSDVAVDEIPTAFKEGSVHKFRVLTVETGRQIISLTAKKSMMNMDETGLFKQQNPNTIKLNDILNGYVSAVMPFGLVVRGFGDFSALIPFTDIVSTLEGREITGPNALSESAKAKVLAMKRYKVGASIKFRISRIANRNQKLNLTASIDLDKESVAPIEEEEEKKKEPSPVSPETSFLERQKINAPLPFTVDLDKDTVESVAQKALEKLGGIGAEIEGRVQLKDTRRNALSVVLWGRLRAWIHAMEITDKASTKVDPLDEYAIGDMVSVRLIGVAPAEALPRSVECCMQDGKGDLNLVEGSLRSTSCPPLPQSVDDLVVGKTYAGVIRSSSSKGVYVYLSSRCYVRIKVRELAGRKVQKLLATGKTMWDDTVLNQLFPVGKVLTSVRIASVSLAKKQAEGTLKTDLLSDLVGRDGAVTFENLSEGDVVVARIKRVESFGVFITFHNSDRLDALCPTTEIVDVGVTLDSKLEPGDHVVVKVLKKDEQRRRITVGMKKSYFTDLDISRAVEKAEQGGDSEMQEKKDDADVAEVAEGTEDEDDASTPPPFLRYPSHQNLGDSRSSDLESEEESTVSADDLGTPRTCDDEDMMELREEDKDLMSEKDIAEARILHKLSTMSSRDWMGSMETSASLDDDDVMKRVKEYAAVSRMMSGSKSSLLRMGQSAELDLENEKLTREIERRNAMGAWEQDPKTVDDFERLVLVSGDTAGCWIGYMAYHVKLQDIEKAREVAKRGIESVESAEKLKIWIAWLNLELNFGDNIKQVLDEALQYNDAKTIYFHMIDEYEKRGDWSSLDALADRMVKKLATDPTVWARYLASLYMRDSRSAELAAPLAAPKDHHNVKISTLTRSRIDETFRKALHRTEKSAHIELQTTVGRFEFRYGSSERGRTIFLKLLAEKPKRTDIWNLLFDAQISALKRNSSKSERSAARQLFTEAIKVALKPTKMRPIFSRWQSFEKTYGDEDSLAICRQAAKAYVESVMAA